MDKQNSTALLLIISAAVALSAGVWFGFDARSPAQLPQVNGTILPAGKTVSAFNLLKAEQDSFTLDDIKNKWSLMFFGYTHCPDVCPTTLATLKRVDAVIKEQGLVSPQVIFVSVDPERDTAELLKQYVSYFNDEFIGVTGEIKELEKLAKDLGIYFKKAAGASGDINQDDYLMDHTTSFVLIDPTAGLAAILRSNSEPLKLAEDIQAVIKLKN